MNAPPSRYTLLDSLGKGGMGEVFLADDTQLGRKVAIKFLTEGLEADAKARERLHREARSAAALDHPYICNIYELAEIDGRTGIVMEHVVGETLQAQMRQSPLPVADALAIAGEIAEALEEAHKRRVMHRDLKPSNVMLTEQGHVKVMDFGLAKAIPAAEGTPEQAETIGPLTDSGIRVGTPGYMSPEQLLGGEADARHVSASYSPHWRVSRRRTRWCGPSSARRRGTRSSSRRSTSTWPRKGSCSMRRGGGAPTSGSRSWTYRRGSGWSSGAGSSG